MSNPPRQIDDARVAEYLDSDMSNVAIARELGCDEASIRRAKKRLEAGQDTKAADATSEPTEPGTARMDLNQATGDGEFNNVTSEAPLTDWAHVFAKFGLDPAEFEIVDDTVRMSVWQQSRRLDNGDRDVVNLYSYKARFRRKVANQGVSITEARDMLRGWSPVRLQPVEGKPVALVVALADWQLGKGEGDGTQGTLRRLENALDDTVYQIDLLRAQGVNPRTLLLANMGDHTEGTHGSYANQPYTVDMNLRDQLQTALEVNLQWVRTLAPLFEHVEYTATLCNHGTLSRAGGRENITDDADNATGLVSDLLQKICGMDDRLANVRFTVPRDQFITTTTVEGVNMALAHGQKISGTETNWLAAQSQNLTQRRKFVPDVWLTAHKHHAQVTDFGPYARIQATTVEPGSKYFEDLTGQYSRTGVTTFTVGAHLPGMWDNYRIV